MNAQQQEWIALAVVFLIAGVFIIRWLRQRGQENSGCSHCEKSSCPSPNAAKPLKLKE
ncbi:MAG: FeoB-associated Cys-rich membrane protein [Pseudomonadales bacterium]|nr:FeoB-associated Cys-rich membrane protein [Pseudomonadales bacterium]